MSELSPSAQLLAQQHSQMTQLEVLLSQESEILQQHKPEALIEITQQKNILLEAIQTLDQTLSTSQAFIKDKADGLCDQALTEIEELLARCKKQNQINGQVIQHSKLAVERMKTTLLENNNKTAVTYNGKGKKSGGLSSLAIKA